MQILGCIIKDPSIFLDDNYKIETEDFVEQFHTIIFAAINNLYHNGNEKPDIISIDNYISNYPSQYAIFEANKGIEYLTRIAELAELRNFKYNYDRVKKFTLLRNYKQEGIDVSEVYNENIVDSKKFEKMSEIFDNMTINEIIDFYDIKQLKIKSKFYDSEDEGGGQAGLNLRELFEKLKITPEFGLSLNSGLLTTVTRGECRGKVHLISSPTGGFKTRSAIADCAKGAIGYLYNIKDCKWECTNAHEPSLFITTELKLDEIQTMLMAYISGVDEAHILDNKYINDEEERVLQAIEYIEKAPLWIEEMPNFSIESIERIVKKHHIINKVHYVFFDYLFSSIALLSQIAQQTRGGIKLREDNALLIFIERLKWLAQDLDIYIRTSTQLNDSYRTITFADQSTLKSCKALADKVDIGAISLPLSDKDKEMIEQYKENGFTNEPNLCYHIYKNRRGKLCFIRLFVFFDGGTLRTTDCFVTNKDYELLQVSITNIEQVLDDSVIPDEELEDFNDSENVILGDSSIPVAEDGDSPF